MNWGAIQFPIFVNCVLVTMSIFSKSTLDHFTIPKEYVRIAMANVLTGLNMLIELSFDLRDLVWSNLLF